MTEKHSRKHLGCNQAQRWIKYLMSNFIRGTWMNVDSVWSCFAGASTLQQQSRDVCSDEECVEFLSPHVLISRMDCSLIWCSAHDVANTCLSKYEFLQNLLRGRIWRAVTPYQFTYQIWFIYLFTKFMEQYLKNHKLLTTQLFVIITIKYNILKWIIEKQWQYCRSTANISI